MQPKDEHSGDPQSIRELLDARLSDARVYHVASVVAEHARTLGRTDIAEPLEGLAHDLVRLEGGEHPLNPKYRPLIEAWCRRDGAGAVLRELAEQTAFGYRWAVADDQEWARVVERLLEVVERASAHA
jgi:hypothetical protein